MADEIDFLTVSNPAPSPITEEELATFLAVGKTWQVEEAEYEKEAERVYQLTEMAILDRQRDEIHQREAERDAREVERDKREADRDKREEERDASPDDFHDGWMKRAERARERDVRKALRDTRKVEREKREEERERCKKLADARRQAEMDRRETERDKREAERDRLAREVDQKTYKTNRENRVELLQAVRAQRASFDDRGENEDDFPDAYIKYLSSYLSDEYLSDEFLSDTEKRRIIEKKAYELYTTYELRDAWNQESVKNTFIFKKYVDMAEKENKQKRLEKEEKFKQSDEGKIIEKACELYKENEPKQGTGHYTACWTDKLATIDYSGRRIHQTQEKINERILYNWLQEKNENSVIFKKYVNMAKRESERERLEKERLEKERLEKQERLKQEKTELQERLKQEKTELQERLQVGSEIDAVDSQKRWYESVILHSQENWILVHYKGWSHKFDEWINMDTESKRIAPVGTHARGEKISLDDWSIYSKHSLRNETTQQHCVIGFPEGQWAIGAERILSDKLKQDDAKEWAEKLKEMDRQAEQIIQSWNKRF